MAAAAAGGGFHEELRAEIQRDLRKYCQGGPFGKVYREQYPLMEQGDLTVPYHVWIGPSNWDKDPVELNREHEKLECLNQLLLQAMKNAGGNNNNLLLQLIIGVDGKLGDTSSYHGQRKELVKRMLLDGCYIVYNFAQMHPNEDPFPRVRGGRHRLFIPNDRKRRVHNAPESAAEEATNNSNHNNNQKCNNNSSSSDYMAIQMEQISESALVAAAARAKNNNNNNNNNNKKNNNNSRSSTELARWLECRDTWCLVDNKVPYDVLDVINHLVYRAPEGVFGGKSARILLQSWSMYSKVRPSQENQVDIVPRATVQQAEAGDANCLLILLAQLLKPQPRDSPLLNRTCCPPLGGPQLQGAELLLYRWRPATEYVRCCNARFVASPLGATERRTVLDVTATIRGCFCSIDVQVPPLTIDGCSLALLRSLVELEQRGITADRCVTAYCFFMHMIASRAEDVELLTRMGIINHGYTDPMDVARGLEKVVAIAHARDVDPYLLPIEHELGRRYKSTVHRCLSRFRFSYWTKADVLLALIAVLLTVPGIVYAGLFYYHLQAA